MIVKTKLTELQDELMPQFENVCLRGRGASSFVYVLEKGRAVEVSEENGGFWLEFWDRSDDEDAPPVKEMTLESPEQVLREIRRWLA